MEYSKTATSVRAAPSLPAGAADPVAWRPIESAPRDGTDFLGCNVRAGGDAYIAHWKDGADSGSLDVDVVDCEGWHGRDFYANPRWFSHWMPLPHPPAEIRASSPSAASAGNPATDHVDLSPTTAGSAEGVKLDLQSVRDWLRALPDLDMEDIAADGGVTVAMVVQQEAREMAARLDRALATPAPIQTGEGR